jgi:signal transduction histidine kinase
MQNKGFSRELDKSFTYIENSLTTSISFEGKAPNLLIDELQFLLNSGCVIIDSPTKSFGNILPDELEVLLDCTKDFPWKQVDSKMNDARVKQKDFGPISELYRDPNLVPLRLALQNVTTAYEIGLQTGRGEWKVTIYYRSDDVSVEFWDSPEPFHEFIVKALKLVANAFHTKQQDDHTEYLERLYSKFKKSPYLESVLEAVGQRIIKHLSESNTHFAQFAENPFFLQVFLVKEPQSSDNRKHQLRFFPLEAQRGILDDPTTKEKIRENLEYKGFSSIQDAKEYITEYLWDSDRSFVGYSCDTETSLYIRNWETEPKPKGIHLLPEEKKEREIATIIMQTLRSNPPHLFTIPLFACDRVIGVVLINCAEDIDQSIKVTPVRCARNTGFIISLALRMDKLVNNLAEEKEKAAQVMSYKHATQSIMHDERSYCMELDDFLGILRNKYPAVDSDSEISPHIDRISFIVRDKLQLVNEFAESSDPIRVVPDELIYPSRLRPEPPPPELRNISVEEIKSRRSLLDKLLNRNERLKSIEIRFGDRLKDLQMIPDFEPLILTRILANLIKNSVAQARKKKIANGFINIDLEILEVNGRDYLQIKAEDNCGGFEDNTLPHRITFVNWMRYLNTQDIPRGMGFLILAKYTEATGGECLVENIEYPERGARILITIGLQAS